jgi:hypothetical protein
MILTLIIVADYWLLWFARKHLLTPQNFEIHLLSTFLILLLNLAFLFSHGRYFRKMEKSFFDLVSCRIGTIADFVDRHSFLIFTLVLVYGTILRLHIIFSFPIDRSFADMLPLVKNAIVTFLSGENPYRTYQMPWALPLVYFPLLWICYIPAYLLRIDIRITGIIISAVILLVFWHESRQGITEPDNDPVRRLLIFILGISFFLSDFSIFFTASGHSFPYWLFLVFYLYFIHSDRLGLASVFLGLSVATRQPAVILVPFYLIYLFKVSSPKKFLSRASLLIATSALLILPFFLANPRTFLFDSFGNVGGELSYAWKPAILGSIGFTNIFYLLKLPGLLPYVQLGILLLLLIVAWVKIRDKSTLFIFSGTAMLFYNMFLFHIPVHYFYFPVFLIFSFVARENLTVQFQMPSPVSFSGKKILKRLAATITLVALLFLSFTDIRRYWIPDRINLHGGFEKMEKNENGFTFHWVVNRRGVASVPASLADIAAGRDRPFVFSAIPFVYPGSPKQHLKVLLNDRPLADLRMKRGWNRYSLTLPAHFLIIGSNKIEFNFTNAAIPREVRLNEDRRRLSAAIHFFQ